MTRILLLFTLLTTITAASAAAPQIHAQEAPQAPFDEALVFEWWDDGIITPEEADEILSRLEEGNYDEACLLAEVYAQEPCAPPKPKSPRKKKSKASARITGHHSAWAHHMEKPVRFRRPLKKAPGRTAGPVLLFQVTSGLPGTADLPARRF